MKKYLLLALFSFVIIFLVMYSNFGGFKSVHIEERTNTTVTLVGKSFEGKANSSDFGDVFKEIDQLGKNDPNLSLTAVYLQNPSKDNDYSVKAFIGFTGDLQDLQIEGLEEKTFTFEKSIYAQKEAHPLLTRLPLNIKEYAKAKSFELDPEIRVEYYYNDRNMAVEIPYSISSN